MFVSLPTFLPFKSHAPIRSVWSQHSPADRSSELNPRFKTPGNAFKTLKYVKVPYLFIWWEAEKGFFSATKTPETHFLGRHGKYLVKVPELAEEHEFGVHGGENTNWFWLSGISHLPS